MNGRAYFCPNCGRQTIGQIGYVRHLLTEAGSGGVTTNQFLAWGAGSRFGARVHELRHEHGLRITERNGLYVMQTVKSGASTAEALPEQGEPTVWEAAPLALDFTPSRTATQCAIDDDWEAA